MITGRRRLHTGMGLILHASFHPFLCRGDPEQSQQLSIRMEDMLQQCWSALVTQYSCVSSFTVSLTVAVFHCMGQLHG